VYDHIKSIGHITNIPVSTPGDALDAQQGCYNVFYLQKAAK
jgi:hypothetical protein